MKILIIEDEPSLCEVIRDYLRREKYVVECASTYGDALQKIADYQYDVILLDIMLPDGSGLSLLEEMKKMGKPENVIIISARDSIEDKVAGLELGADDYLAKPFHLAELGARIKTVMRRKTMRGDTTLRAGNVSVDTAGHEVSIGGSPVELNRKEYDILCYMMLRPESLINRYTLAEAVWGDHIDQADNFDFLYAQVKNLRKKLIAAGADTEIRAVYGFGYKLTVRECD